MKHAWVSLVVLVGCRDPKSEVAPTPVSSEVKPMPSPTLPAPVPSSPPLEQKLSYECKVDSDCTMTTYGDDCCDGCGNVAVNAASLERVKYKCTKIKRACPAIDCPFQPATAVCVGGRCKAVPKP